MSSYNQPLATRMRPQSLQDFVGQAHLIAEGKTLHRAYQQRSVHSMILWGPPGSGKTTLAKLLAAQANADVIPLSAVMSGVKDIRAAVAHAENSNQGCVLFIDEIHRFNKSQQDALLPHVEAGILTLIGATTENPSFALNNALLSRVRVYVLKALTMEDIEYCIQEALNNCDKGLGGQAIKLSTQQIQHIAKAADGDARAALNLLEILADFAVKQDGQAVLSDDLFNELMQQTVRHFDKHGDIFHEQISALHKAVRGSASDAALYWLCRLLDGGCDPYYLARRIIRMATEDIGNADPRGLSLALDAWEVYERLGSPEGELALAQAVIYLSFAAKSNASYKAFNAAMEDAKRYGNLSVPMHLRNSPTALMKAQGYGRDYRYAHDEAHGYAAGEQYFPDGMQAKQYYNPVDRGLEIKIKEKLARLKSLDDVAQTRLAEKD